MNENIKQHQQKISLTKLIMEDEGGGGGDYGGDSSLSGIQGDYYDSLGMGGGGSHGGGFKDDVLYKAFIQPFTDIVQTSLWALKTLSTKAKYFIVSQIDAIIGLLNPFYASDYESYRKKEITELGKLNNKYAEVLKRNVHYLYDHDLWGIAYVLDPSLMLGSKVIQNIPSLVKELTSLLGFQKDKPSYDNPYFHESIIQNKTYSELLKEFNVVINEAEKVDQQQIEQLKTAIDNSKQAQSILQEYRIAYLDKLLQEVKDHVSDEAINKLFENPQIMQQYQQKFGSILVKNPNYDGPIKNEFKKRIKENIKNFYIQKLQEAVKISPKLSDIISNYINQIKQI